MSSRLLASLYPATLPQAAIMGGFEAAIDAAEDLSLDCPDASHLLGLFLARAVVDDVLPPAFLQARGWGDGGWWWVVGWWGW